MNKKIKQPPKLNKGFSLVEMMLSLAILGTVMSISYGVIASVQHQQFRNSSLDLMKAQENIAIKYLNSNYDPIYKKIIATNSQNNYLPIVVKLDDMANYLNTAPLNFNSNSFYPTCLIINADSYKHQLNVFMLYPKKNFNDSVFTKGEVKKLSGEKNYSKVVDSTSPLVSANMNLIRSGCDIPDVYPNSMLVNLNKNMDFSSKKAMTTDSTQTTGSTSETLKSNDNNLLK